ncbi:hypothetical protein [Sphingobium aromaticiconvertens]|uniref:hypothetical protein n=1 Tax=Sphingobium aromaticiconvertens TaxID=365341 RepID=UPI0030175142
MQQFVFAKKSAGRWVNLQSIVRKSGNRLFAKKRCDNKELEQAPRDGFNAACSRKKNRAEGDLTDAGITNISRLAVTSNDI